MGKLREDYNSIASSFSRSRKNLWTELGFLFQYAQKKDKVLDIGCGNGRFSSYLTHTDYTGLDFSEKLIAEAKKIFPELKFVVADALHLPFEDDTFDKVYSIALIHHIPSEEYRVLALKEMRRVVTSGGLVFVTAWKRRIPWWRRLFSLYDISIPFNGRERYYHLFKSGELSRIARKAGLVVIKEGVAEEKKRSNFYLIAKA